MSVVFDTATDPGGASSTSPVTWSHTVTSSGNNRILYLAVESVSGVDDITAVTYNGVSLTKITGVVAGTGRFIALYYLLAPATGSHTVSISFSNVTQHTGCAASYTGVSQTAQPDTSNTTSSSATISTTTLNDKSWLFGVFISDASPTTAGAGTTIRRNPSADVFAVADSNGAKSPAGLYSLVNGTAGASQFGGIVVGVNTLSSVTITDTQATTDLAKKKPGITILDTQASTDVLSEYANHWNNASRNSPSWTAQPKTP